MAVAGRGGPGASDIPAGLGVGGGLIVEFFSTATVTRTLISGNAAIGGAGGAGNDGGDGLGGGVAVGLNAYVGDFPEDSHVTLIDSLIFANLALGGAGGAGADGGDGLGGGIWIFSREDTSASVTLENTDVTLNRAQGGRRGSGGQNGEGIGGGVYNLGGEFLFDVFSAIRRNRASTSNDDIFSSPS